MNTIYSYSLFIPLIPLAAFLLLGLFGKKMTAISGMIATTALFISAMISILIAWQYFFVDGMTEGIYRQLIPYHVQWLQFTTNVSIDMGIVLDPISVMMIVVVTFISLMVHIFSLGYMKGEERFATYYAFLCLFTFSMLGLVLSTNIFQIYMFWELVGVSSFLLIGFYYNKPSAVAASKKAFIVTRFADLGFLIGILILAFHAETLDFATLINRLTSPQSTQFISITSASFIGISVLTWGLVLVFIGGAGKSAMFPLHIWLPDAMEGPTPVSALIHAATMVVAGVFLVARLFPVFAMDPAALQVVTFVGAFSAVMAAVIACTQTDIKRVLAYSTMSQIGFMMFALGISGYGGEQGLGFMASMFHLLTHAFFKSLLFLGAGAVIHLVHSNEMNAMGGLRKKMPITHFTFLIACLAISGIPPFAGFFSKEEILLAAFHSNKLVYFIALLTSALTAFYMFRLYFSIFWNKTAPVHENHHGEGTLTMKLPLLILVTGTILVGFLPFAKLVTSDGKVLESHIDYLFSLAPVLLALSGIYIASMLYKTENDKSVHFSSAISPLYKAAHNRFYVDEVYLFITKKIIFNMIGRPAAWIDKNIVDGLMNFIADQTASISEIIKGLQSGKIQSYMLYFFGGICGLAILFIYLYN